MPIRTQRAFTLIELLVVISIVAVLVSLLLPSLRNAREVGVMIKCSSGVRQVGLAHSIYMTDWNQTMIATGYVTQGDGWYPRLVNNGYAQQPLFTNKGGCPYAPAPYLLGDNNDVFYGHQSPSKHSSYAMNQVTGFIDYITKKWSVNDWNGVSYTARGTTSTKPHRFKRFQKWPSDIMIFHCSTCPNSTTYGYTGINVRYTLGIITGNWTVDPALTTYARHKGTALPMSFFDLHVEQVKPELWITDTKREIRWKSLPAFNKTEYANSGAYLNPDL
jgi:prepilin-type N-terminal cleavage/methylation domain-containing protein